MELLSLVINRLEDFAYRHYLNRIIAAISVLSTVVLGKIFGLGWGILAFVLTVGLGMLILWLIKLRRRFFGGGWDI